MRIHLFKRLLLCASATLVVAGCSPAYNWRNFSSSDAPFSVMFPDKPSVHTREIDIDGMKVSMTMTAAQVEGTTFAVGSAQAPDAAQARAALAGMKTALVKNIGATVRSEKTAGNGIDIDAVGMQKGTPMRLVARFEARDKRFYQVIIMGPEKTITKENVEMFMSSFKLQ